ncbi:2-succinyl-5-enolpyruvyl-6-hydroxy-3-cyclohexene-1-carboxylate synthase [Anoxybacillus kamchatkensis]|uniref:2-succinyl-5-enolpyruvyl-6-hydroxy-3- cyclohexene-1-carboxylic-acid synthase n=1 Tax=Anoxybacillus ayderensis TaxID=265546 RepID=UPI0015EC7333|nr:2-succinyl-5-enolpyruvyl-6-hydroxy-3-cyclohexene-1-carboxylic-acid synthase [Anoxybacillus ayderensis]MBA2878298.1 2-succinyl-5-enolpyruvyl-6-hydroxy-3-cyclohexene-1-carboxylate synthase [Anoxybacillus ayderensis]
MNEMTAYVAAFVEQFVHTGIQQVVISPGSRSTPLAMVMAEHPQLNIHVHIDERSAAFFALGMAKASGKPVALVCTSGTAVANYYPAIVEAYYARVPLVVITADRPHELRDVGAPQAIDQLHMYGSYVKWFVDMALPEGNEQMLRYAEMVAARAVCVATSVPAGPVHINVPLREPLVPMLNESLFSTPSVTRTVYRGNKHLSQEMIDELYEQLRHVEKGVIVCGDFHVEGFADAVVELAEALQYPILADPLSSLRTGVHRKQLIIESYDAMLKCETFADAFIPDVVIRFGAMPVSKSLYLWLQRHKQVKQMIVDEAGQWRDPTLSLQVLIEANEVQFCHELAQRASTTSRSSQWVNQWKKINERAKQMLLQAKEEENMFEGKIFIELAQLLPDEATLFVGNSMPIRDADTFFMSSHKRIRLLANRGANGIDGVVSSALGASCVAQPLVLVIGDLSFYHDLNGLLAAKLQQLHATIIVLNNNGGGIFSFLPQANEPKHFERLFGTPTHLSFHHVVNMYDGHYEKVETWDHFRRAVVDALVRPTLNVIEVPSSREYNVGVHRKLWKDVSQEMSNLLNKGE